MELYKTFAGYNVLQGFLFFLMATLCKMKYYINIAKRKLNVYNDKEIQSIQLVDWAWQFENR